MTSIHRTFTQFNTKKPHTADEFMAEANDEVKAELLTALRGASMGGLVLATKQVIKGDHEPHTEWSFTIMDCETMDRTMSGTMTGAGAWAKSGYTAGDFWIALKGLGEHAA